MNRYKKAIRVTVAALAAAAVLSGSAGTAVFAEEMTTLNASEALLKEQRLNMWYSQAIDSINNADYENALLCLDGCITSVTKEGNPTLYADVYMKRGYCYTMLGKNEDAIEALDVALETDPEMENALLIKVSAYSAMGDYEPAIETLEQYIDLTGDATMYETMSSLYEAQGDADKALESFEKYAAGNSGSESQAAFDTGYYLMQRGQYEKAAEYFGKCLESEEPVSGAYYNRGLCYMSIGDYESAAADFGASAEAGEEGAEDALYTKATCEMTILDYENAIADFTTCIEQGQQAEDSRINRGICQMLSGNTTEALADFDDCIEQDIKPDEARFYRAYVYLSGKEYESALADLTECINNGYDLGASYLQRAQVYKEMGDTENYQADLEAAKNAQAAAAGAGEVPAEEEAVTEAITE